MHIFSVIYHIVYMYDVVVCSVSVFLPVCTVFRTLRWLAQLLLAPPPQAPHPFLPSRSPSARSIVLCLVGSDQSQASRGETHSFLSEPSK